jgi:hypothetical protein
MMAQLQVQSNVYNIGLCTAEGHAIALVLTSSVTLGTSVSYSVM